LLLVELFLLALDHFLLQALALGGFALQLLVSLLELLGQLAQLPLSRPELGNVPEYHQKEILSQRSRLDLEDRGGNPFVAVAHVAYPSRTAASQHLLEVLGEVGLR
jgi:hypothetical protein